MEQKVTIRERNIDNRTVIEVKGKCIVLSDIKSRIESISTYTAVDEVRIFAAVSLTVDVNLSHDVWHGRNLVVLANEITVNTTVSWDVSGKNNGHNWYWTNAGNGEDGLGKDGSDGYPGESGGNVLVMANTIEHPERLTIISNGGNGSDGQDGGNGQDGVDGKGISEEQFKQHFRHCLKFWRGTRIDRVTKIVRSIYEMSEKVYIEWMKKKPLCNDEDAYVTSNLLEHLKDDNYFDIYLHVVTHEGNEISFSLWGKLFKCYSFLLYKGSPGKPGKSGGGYGMGGQGGFPGEITVGGLIGGSTFDIRTYNNWGNDGKNGQGGLNGCYGKNGWDMGFLGQLWTKPSVFGRDQNSKLQLSFSFEKSSHNIFHPYMAKYSGCNVYVSINKARIDHPSIIRERNNTVARNERENHSKAVGKKSVSRMRMVTAFTEYIQEIIRENQELERKRVDTKQQKSWQNEQHKHKKQRTRRKRFESKNKRIDKEKQKLEKQRIESEMFKKMVEQQAKETERNKQEIKKEMQQFEKQKLQKEMRRLENIHVEAKKHQIEEELQQIKQENQLLTHKQLLECIENETMVQDVESKDRDCLTGIEIKRFVNFSHDTNGQNRFEFVQLDKSYEEDNQEEILAIFNKVFNVDHWLQLQFRIVDFNQLESLVKHFDTYKPWLYLSHGFHTEYSDKIKTIAKILKIKYKLSVLRKIAQELPIYHAETKKIMLTSQNAIRYLEEAMEQGDPIYHSVLGTLRQYIFENSQTHRKKFSEYVLTKFKISYNAYKRGIKTYILEVHGSEKEYEREKQCYDDYQEFVKGQQKKVDSIIESLVAELKQANHKETFRLWNESVDDDEIPKDLEEMFRQNKSLRSLYDKFTQEKNAEYDWERCCADEHIQENFKNHLEQEGIMSRSYRVLLAHVYGVNIRVYTRGEAGEIVLFEDLSFQSFPAVHILLNAKKFFQLKVNENYRYLEQERQRKDQIYRSILTEVSAMQSIKNIKRYFKRELFNQSRSSFVETSEKLNEEITIKKIASFFPVEEREHIAQRLKIVSSQYTGQQGVVESLLECFSFEGRHVSSNELYFLINSILTHTLEARQESYTFSWIISAYHQCNWTDELVLLQLENCFKSQLQEKSKWRELMSNIDNKGVLLVFAAQLARNPCSAECVEDILHLLSNIAIESVCLDQLELTEWPYVLKEYYWIIKLKSLMAWDNESDMLTSASFFVLSIENTYGDAMLMLFFETLKGKFDDLKHDVLLYILSNFHDQKWTLCMESVNVLQQSSLKEWIEQMEQKFKINLKELDVVQLVNIIKGNANMSTNIARHLSTIANSVTDINQNNSFSNDDSITKFSTADIEKWAKAFRENRRKSFADQNAVILAVIDRAIELNKGFKLRNTQRLTVLAMLANDNKTLAQVSTGEGKTLIVVAIAVIKGLLGEKVDIITSSSVLAQRDAKENKKIYELFGISASHNCSENMEERKEAYSCNQIMYGDLANFQRDYLLDRFYGKHALGDRSFENVIVDEVDSMLLDKGNNMLYLSHDIAGMDKLESVYVFIWQMVNTLTYLTDDEVVKTIKRSVLNDMYPSIQKEDIANLDIALGKSHVLVLWERLVKFGITNFSGRLLSEKMDSKKLDEALSPDFTQYKDRLSFLLWSRIEREAYVKVPNFLKPFVERHLNGWISSALTALYMVPGQYYVVDVDRSGTSADRHANVIILDKDTGTDQLNSQWDEALHQFLQLKHGCKLSTQSLKAVFISNVTYLKMYKLLYGLTGTLGSQRERHLLKEIHQVDFVTIPTAKTKQFEEYEPIICSSKEDWKHHIHNEVNKLTIIDKRSVLIICETIRNVESLKQIFNSCEHVNVFTYVRDYEKFSVDEGGLERGQIIIATNLAVRGTDIKISNELRDAGGLHVILTYLPANIRIEEQAFGRAARSGDKGSGRMIIMVGDGEPHNRSLIFTLKKKRNIGELFRLSAIKSYYETTIKTEEDCFKAFNELYGEKMKCLANADTPETVKEILLQSILDKWSFWLDVNNAMIEKSSDEATKQHVKLLLEEFVDQFKFLEATDTTSWLAWVEGNPIQMKKLGKYLSQHESKHYATALRLFDKVIKNEPHFCEAAYYYRAYALSLDEMNINDFKSELQKAESLFEEHVKSAMYASGVVEILKISTLQDEGFEEQKTSLINLYSLFIQSIHDMLGHAITPDSFVNYEIKENVSGKIFDDLMQIGMLKEAKIVGNVSEVQLEKLHFEYGTSVEILKEFLASNVGTIDEKEFLQAIRSSFSFPSRVEFWELLVNQNVLHSVEEYFLIDEKRLAMEEPALMNFIKEKVDKGRLVKATIELRSNQILLIHEQQSVGYFEKKKLIENIGKRNIDFLEKKGLFSFNKKATIDKSKMADCVFSTFDSVTAQDIMSKTRITAIEANNIIEELVEQKVLEKRGDLFALSVKHDQDILLPTYPVYENVIRNVLALCFAYRLALRNISLQLEDEAYSIMRIELQQDPHRMFFNDLIEQKIIQLPTLNESFDVDDAVEKVCEIQRFSKNSTIANHITKVLQRSKSSLAALKKPKGNLLSIMERFGKGNFGNAEEMRTFITNGLEHFLQLGEKKKWTFEMMLSISAVACIGLAQLAIGAIMEVCSIGRTKIAASLVKEGIKDVMFSVNAGISGDFTWKNYGKQKWQRIVATVCKTYKDTIFSNEAKLPLLGCKLVGPSVQFVDQNVIDASEKLRMKPVEERTVLADTVKRMTQKTAEGVSFAVSKTVIDKIVADHLQNELNSFASDILSGVKEKVADHHVSKSLQKAYDSLGERDAKIFVGILTNKYMMEQMISQTFLPVVRQIFQVVKNGMESAMENMDNASNAIVLNNRLSMAMNFVDCTEQVSKMRTATQDLLDNLNTKMARKLSDIGQNYAPSTKNLRNQVEFERFNREVFEKWETKISEHVGQLIAQGIVHPILKTIVNSVTSSTGISLKDIRLGMVETKQARDTWKLKTNSEKKTDRPNMSVETKRQLIEKYHGLLLKMMHKTRTPALFATIIRENVPMDMACVGTCAAVLQKMLQSLNPTIKGLTITVHGEKTVKKSFSFGKGGPVIYLTLIDNHFTVSPVEGCFINMAENNCLSEALAIASPELQSMGQKSFRLMLSYYIENNESIQDHIRQGLHHVL